MDLGNWTRREAILAGAATALLAGRRAAAAGSTQLTLYYPVVVGGPLTKIIEEYAAQFESENPEIKITPVYAGSNLDVVTKAMAAAKSGNPPQVAVMAGADMYTLVDGDVVLPYEDLIRTDEERAWMKGFFPAFMTNVQTGGKTYAIPWQRSTAGLFWNKSAFSEVGLDPEKPPETWEEMVAYARKLTKRDANGNVVRWGIQIPSSYNPYWPFQALVAQNGVAEINNPIGTETYFNKPAVIEALQFWVDLSRKEKVHPPGIVDWGTTPRDFIEQRAAMIWHTTGNLGPVRDNAKFPFGLGMLPTHVRRGLPTGGGNLYIFKNTKPEERAAALRFVRWMTRPERTADWSIRTGYTATRPDAWETPAMKEYVKKVPVSAVLTEQLQYAVGELSTHDNQRIDKAINDALEAALEGKKSPEAALNEAQREADRVLKPYRRS